MSPPPPQQSPQSTNMIQNSLSLSPSNQKISSNKIIAREKSNGSIQEMFNEDFNNESNSFNRTK